MSRPRVRVPSPAPTVTNIPSRTSLSTQIVPARDTSHPRKARVAEPKRGLMADLPSGTVTFLFTDIEGSTRLLEEHPDAMSDALARHDELLREAIEGHGG